MASLGPHHISTAAAPPLLAADGSTPSGLIVAPQEGRHPSGLVEDVGRPDPADDKIRSTKGYCRTDDGVQVQGSCEQLWEEESPLPLETTTQRQCGVQKERRGEPLKPRGGYTHDPYRDPSAVVRRAVPVHQGALRTSPFTLKVTETGLPMKPQDPLRMALHDGRDAFFHPTPLYQVEEFTQQLNLGDMLMKLEKALGARPASYVLVGQIPRLFNGNQNEEERQRCLSHDIPTGDFWSQCGVVNPERTIKAIVVIAAYAHGFLDAVCSIELMRPNPQKNWSTIEVKIGLADWASAPRVCALMDASFVIDQARGFFILRRPLTGRYASPSVNMAATALLKVKQMRADGRKHEFRKAILDGRIRHGSFREGGLFLGTAELPSPPSHHQRIAR